MKLDPAGIAAVRTHLLGPDGASLIDYMFRLNTGGDVSAVSGDTRAASRDLGWTDAADQLTGIGSFAADSCREYVFWTERDRDLPFKGIGGLTREYFAGKAVVEVGAGMGANLMSLGATVTDLSGVEPLEIYSQMGGILREREGLAPVDVRTGSGEQIPFPDGRFDVVLCVTAHQYMDICPALKELARVLKPGGELIIIGGTLDRYVKDAMAAFPANLKAHVITVVNTLGYTALRRRIIPGRGAATTSRPIYPLPATMQRWMQQAGLQPKSPLLKVDTETIFQSKRTQQINQ
ncbi:class I SAM-dependent methyltransferase [Sedimentitalea todarodis]|uniref:Class I SAM-dependent methyltransferase n=1 Tax=Sedimentitalea todarodis TaxID=1631240 RepID=A0ABU3VH96_9RHOB|nr:class I SAM-dependent methyltransferase [Sedimentitalea todarodis]MDU9005544.1 class I SAM-dependent methyltransferase [Sedimentitalea todarodis]